MIKPPIKIKFSGLLVCFCALFFVVIYLVYMPQFMLYRSLDYLLSDLFKINYTIQKLEYTDLVSFDPSASWLIRIDEEHTNKIIPNIITDSRFPWDDELIMGKRYFQHKFMYKGPLDGYELYKLNIPTGIISMCQSKDACKIYILKKRGESDMFVRINKM